MDGAHDLGGRQGFGTVEVEAAEPVFHSRWEGRTFACTSALLVSTGTPTPRFRHAIERMDPGHYLTSSYYEHWLTAAATLLVEAGIVEAEELTRRLGPFPLSRPPLADADEVDDLEAHSAEPRYATGDLVRVRQRAFSGHSRCPAYVRGRRGVVVRLGPAAPDPEVEAHRNERVPEATYTIGFAASELWPGPGATHRVHVDLYDHDLEPAGGDG